MNLGERPTLAIAALEEARRYALALNRGKLLTLIDLLSARALDDLGRGDDAMASRSRAVQSGYQQGLVHTFLDEGPLARKELGLLVQNQASPERSRQFARKLLAEFPDDDTTEGLAIPVETRPHASRGQAALTQREIEILELVAQAMSNKRIALTLKITIETVKWNLRNVFSKLEVSSRYNAMVWARNRNLIQ
jgi:LuxR family transcriptional regulator, maltose regulon positive regulatory protein